MQVTVPDGGWDAGGMQQKRLGPGQSSLAGPPKDCGFTVDPAVAAVGAT